MIDYIKDKFFTKDTSDDMKEMFVSFAIFIVIICVLTSIAMMFLISR